MITLSPDILECQLFYLTSEYKLSVTPDIKKIGLTCLKGHNLRFYLFIAKILRKLCAREALAKINI